MNTILKADNTSDIVKLANRERIANRNKWIFLELHKGDSITLCKSFNTSIQVLRRDGINYPSTFDQSVKDWKAAIERALE